MEDYDPSERMCDICSVALNPLDYYVNFNRERDFCNKCDFTNLPVTVKNYDRRNMTVAEKPLNWECYKCDKKLGGGHNWYLIMTDRDYDACEDCYAKYGTSEFKYDLSKGTYHNPCPLEGEPDFEIKIPNGIDPADLKPVDEEIRRLNCNDFGYLSQWRQLSDWYEVPHYPAGTMLIIDCGPKHNGRVCSAAYDDHGRVSFDIVYNDVDTYLAEKASWKVPTDVDNNLKKIKSLLNDRVYDIDTQLYLNVCTDFSAYVRLSKNLDVYFG